MTEAKRYVVLESFLTVAEPGGVVTVGPDANPAQLRLVVLADDHDRMVAELLRIIELEQEGRRLRSLRSYPLPMMEHGRPSSLIKLPGGLWLDPASVDAIDDVPGCRVHIRGESQGWLAIPDAFAAEVRKALGCE